MTTNAGRDEDGNLVEMPLGRSGRGGMSGVGALTTRRLSRALRLGRLLRRGCRRVEHDVDAQARTAKMCFRDDLTFLPIQGVQHSSRFSIVGSLVASFSVFDKCVHMCLYIGKAYAFCLNKSSIQELQGSPLTFLDKMTQ